MSNFVATIMLYSLKLFAELTLVCVIGHIKIEVGHIKIDTMVLYILLLTVNFHVKSFTATSEYLYSNRKFLKKYHK